MSTIAVLGIGLLGDGFARNLIDKGHTVQVWNRTASKAAPLAEAGAKVAATPAEAVAGASRVHLVLKSDEAVDEVIAALRPSLGDGVFVIDHSTNLPAGVAERFARLRGEGVRYMHAPVFMGPDDTRHATGLMLLSGPAEDEAALRKDLETMAEELEYFGDEPDKAAKIKIIGNGLLMVLVGGMGDLFKLGKAAGIGHEAVLELFGHFAPSAAGMGQRSVGASSRPADFTMTMARKDLALMLKTAGPDAELCVLPSIAAAMDRAIEQGRGEQDFTSLADPTR